MNRARLSPVIPVLLYVIPAEAGIHPILSPPPNLALATRTYTLNAVRYTLLCSGVITFLSLLSFP